MLQPDVGYDNHTHRQHMEGLASDAMDIEGSNVEQADAVCRVAKPKEMRR